MSNIGLSVDGSIKRMQTGLYGYLRFFYTYKNKINIALAIALIVTPLTTNQRRASLPICMLIEQGNGELSQDSVLGTSSPARTTDSQ
jgi:hypothetical protein